MINRSLFFQGSVLTPSPLFLNFDAVTCIELVEHLKPEVLPAFKKNIFGYIRPNLVVISTPNFDFNILFSNDNKLRHWDHKFEWTKNEFQTWCHEICAQFNYCVCFDGVGRAPESKKELGFCSQFAIFHKSEKNITQTYINGITDGLDKFETVAVSIHPYESAKAQQETRFYVKFCSFVNSLASLCKTLLATIEDDKPKVNSLQRMFMHLRLKSSTYVPISLRKQNKVFTPYIPDQFCDALECDSGDCNNNSYGQKRYLLVIEPSSTTHNYLQKLRDKYMTTFDSIPALGQFDDCETDIKLIPPNSYNKPSVVHYIKTIDLAKYDPSFPYIIQVTDATLAEEENYIENVVLYKTCNVLKIPLLWIVELEEMKPFNLDQFEIE